MNPFNLDPVIQACPGWYRGDFHAHTQYSDGALTPHELLDAARNAGLDFFAITDHNTIDALPHFGNPDDILVIPGMEVTLPHGHYNVFGLRDLCDGLDGLRRPRHKHLAPTKRMAAVSEQGLLNSINHPCLPPWHWRDETTDLRFVHCLEIWNDPSFAANSVGNPRAVQLWTAWLNAGHRVTAIGGSDFHSPFPKLNTPQSPEQLGVPSTYVYARELSTAAILQSLREGRTYISLGPQVAFQASVKGRHYAIGSDLGEIDSAVLFTATVMAAASPFCTRLLKNGQVIAEATSTSEQLTLHYEDRDDYRKAAWYRLDVLNLAGQHLAITNPIFRGPKPAPMRCQYGDFMQDAEWVA